ncbi:hypothetical protein [Streptomyces albipurpureus]|uniref:Dynamin family protein n=1 Tax=Streptomyces albipurpureus TaxID=2897419 RepID=A0ABT0UZH6_9ACTN|nr:hypothetical protein [Streptomyces sp. CWNU-1]MCM2393869.1 hypothetical protein [Streptomyces sp. CWNU-1]
MAPQLNLTELRRFADDTLAMLEQQEIPGTQEAHDRHAEVMRFVLELRDRVRKPVTFGVVGEFSVGKSLLLGSVLGRPDLLPVEDRKATGNITVLRLRQAPASGADGIDEATPSASAESGPHQNTSPPRSTRTAPTAEVHYLSEKRLRACVRSIMTDLADGMDEDHPVLGAGHVLGDYDPLTDSRGWGPFDQWISCLWPANTPDAPQPLIDPIQISATHVAAATELCRIRDALLSQTDVLGTVQHVSTKVVREALDHGTEERIPTSKPRPRIQPFSAAEVEKNAEILARSFMLIERVVFDVEVSPEHWELHQLLAEHPLQFLDFPGIGGAGSYGRDVHLSRSELAEVHTILVVLDSRKPGGRGVEEFWGMLVKDGRPPEALAKAALVAANSFDRVLVPTLPDIELPKSELLQRSDSLNGIHVHSDKFVKGRESAVVATSSVSAIRRYGLPYAELSQGTRDVIEDALQKLDQGPHPRWESTAARFDQVDPQGPWGRRLRDAEHDGGIRALQRLIESQLRSNGTEQKVERAEASRRKLWSALLALQYQIRQESSDGDPGAAEYNRLLDQIRRFRFLVDALLSQLRDLRGGVPDAAQEQGSGTDTQLPQVVRELPPPPSLASAAGQVLEEVYDWAEWEQLLLRARTDKKGLVTKSKAPTASPRKPLPGRKPVQMPTESAADTSKGYITRFTALVAGRTDQAEKELKQWLTSWQTAWKDTFEELRLWFEEPGTIPLLEEVFLAYIGDAIEVENRLEQLWNALDPQDVVERQAASHAADPLPEEDVAERFPAQADHALPWHHGVRDLDPMTESQERHPQMVTQFRLYAANTAASLVTDRLNRLLSARVDALIGFYKETAVFLPTDDDIRPPRSEPPEPDAPDGSGGPTAPDGGSGQDGPDGPVGPSGAGQPGEAPGRQPIDQLISTWRNA